MLGSKYDLDFKSPRRSGQNFKSGEEMIEIYKELCRGIWTCCDVLWDNDSLFLTYFGFFRLSYCVYRGSIWQGGLGTSEVFFRAWNLPGLFMNPYYVGWFGVYVFGKNWIIWRNCNLSHIWLEGNWTEFNNKSCLTF